MNNDTVNTATNQPVTINNDATPDSDFFAANDANIAPDAYFLSSGIKLDTEIFSKGDINNMADKYTINTTPVPNLLNADTPKSAAQDDSSTDSNPPYCDACYIFCHYYKSLKKESYKKSDNFIDDDDGYDAVDEDVNDPNVITYVKLEV